MQCEVEVVERRVACSPLPQQSLAFFLARKVAFAASSMEVAAFEFALLGAIAGMFYHSTNGGRQMLELANLWLV